MSPSASAEPLKTFAASRSEAAFQALVHAHAGMVTGVARRITGSPELAEEVTQDVFTLLARRAASLARGDAPLPVWLHRTATYMALNARKRERRRYSTLEKMMNQSPPAPATTTAPGHEAIDAAPEWLPHLDAALDRLPAADRALLLLHHATGLTFAEASTRLGLKPEAAKKRGQRALERLRQAFGHIRGGHTPYPASTASLALAAAFGNTAAVPPGKAATLSATALSTAKAAPLAPLLLNLLHTMNHTKTAAAAAACLTLGHLGWQQFEISSARHDLDSLRAKIASATIAVRPPSVPKAATPRSTGPAPVGFDELASLFASMESRRFSSGVMRLPAILRALSADETAQLLETSRTAEVGPKIRDKMREALLERLAELDPQKAVSMAMEFWETASGSQAGALIFNSGNLFSAWLKKDQTAALRWLEESGHSGVLASREVNGGSPLRIMRGAALLTLSRHAPEQARAFLERLPDDEKIRALNHAAGRMERSDPWPPLLSLMKTLPPAERTENVTSLASRVGQRSLDEALQLIAQAELTPEGTAEALAGGISEAGRDKPLQEALDWLAKHAPPGTADLARFHFLTTGGVWYHNQEAVGTVAGFIARGAVTDSQIAEFATKVIPLVRNESGEVLRMAAGIADPALRQETTTKVAAAWAGRGHSAAKESAAAIQALSLPDAEKTALLNAAAR